MAEVQKAYSHTPARLDELRKAVEIVRRQEPDNPDDGRNEAASRPSRRALADRLSPEDVQMIIDLYQGGTPTKGPGRQVRDQYAQCPTAAEEAPPTTQRPPRRDWLSWVTTSDANPTTTNAPSGDAPRELGRVSGWMNVFERFDHQLGDGLGVTVQG